MKEMARVSNGNYVHAVNQEQLNAEFQQTVDMSKIWADWHKNAQDTMNQLYTTLQSQLNIWYKEQQTLNNREYKNLQSAVNYLNEEEILDTDVFLEFDRDYRDYFPTIDSDARKLFLELDSLNRDSFLDNWQSFTDQFLKNVN